MTEFFRVKTVFLEFCQKIHKTHAFSIQNIYDTYKNVFMCQFLVFAPFMWANTSLLAQ